LAPTYSDPTVPYSDAATPYISGGPPPGTVAVTGSPATTPLTASGTSHVINLPTSIGATDIVAVLVSARPTTISGLGVQVPLTYTDFDFSQERLVANYSPGSPPYSYVEYWDFVPLTGSPPSTLTLHSPAAIRIIAIAFKVTGAQPLHHKLSTGASVVGTGVPDPAAVNYYDWFTDDDSAWAYPGIEMLAIGWVESGGSNASIAVPSGYTSLQFLGDVTTPMRLASAYKSNVGLFEDAGAWGTTGANTYNVMTVLYRSPATTSINVVGAGRW
jgi:hypothetical protein